MVWEWNMKLRKNNDRQKKFVSCENCSSLFRPLYISTREAYCSLRCYGIHRRSIVTKTINNFLSKCSDVDRKKHFDAYYAFLYLFLRTNKLKSRFLLSDEIKIMFFIVNFTKRRLRMIEKGYLTEKYNPTEELKHLESVVRTPYLQQILKNLIRISYRADLKIEDIRHTQNMVSIEKGKIQTIALDFAMQNNMVNRVANKLQDVSKKKIIDIEK